MGSKLDDNDKLDPAMQAEIQEAMDGALASEQTEALVAVAQYVRRVYTAFREAKFNRRESFALSVMMFQKTLYGDSDG